MIIRRKPLTFAQRQYIYVLKSSLNKSFREIEKILAISKSRAHYNFEEIQAEMKSIESTALSSTQSLVLFVLSGVLEGKMSTRSIESMMSSLYGENISHQTILEILKEAAEIAKTYNEAIDLSFLKAAIFDEIFQSQLPILSMADPVSGLIMLKNTIDRSGDQWAIFLDELKHQGMDPYSVTTDGGTGLLKGLSMALPDTVTIRDLFHVLYKMSKAKRVMEGQCYALMNLFYKKPSKGLEEEMDKAIKIFDEFEVLTERLRKSSYLADENGIGYYTTSTELSDIVTKNYMKMEEFCEKIKSHQATRKAISYLKNGIESIISYKKFIEQKVKETFGDVYKDVIYRGILPIVESMMQYQRSYEDKERREYWGKLIISLCQRLREYALKKTEELDIVVGKCWNIVHCAVKSNSYIESVNSVIRCHLDTFKSIPNWFCQLFTFYWNNRVFTRGKRADKSPIEIYRPDLKKDKSWLNLIMVKFPFHKFRSGITPNLRFKEAG